MKEVEEKQFPESLEPELPISSVGAGMIVFFSVFLFMIIGGAAHLFTVAIWGQVEWKSPFMIVEIFIVIPAVLIVRKYRFPLKAAFRLNPVSLDIMIWSFMVGISLAILGDQLDRIIQSWYPMPAKYLDQLELTFQTTYAVDFIILFLIGTAGAGICEEVLFRGFFQKILEKRMHIIAAIVFPAVLFGIIHIFPWVIFQITILGGVFGLIAWRTDSVYPTILIHAVNNAIAILFLKFATPKVESVYLRDEFVDPKIVLVSIVIFIISIIRIWHKSSQKSDPEIANSHFRRHS